MRDQRKNPRFARAEAWATRKFNRKGFATRPNLLARKEPTTYLHRHAARLGAQPPIPIINAYRQATTRTIHQARSSTPSSGGFFSACPATPSSFFILRKKKAVANRVVATTQSCSAVAITAEKPASLILL